MPSARGRLKLSKYVQSFLASPLIFNIASAFQSFNGGAHEFEKLIQEQSLLGQSKNWLQSRLANAFPRILELERQPESVWVKEEFSTSDSGFATGLQEYHVYIHSRILRAGGNHTM
jgi:hypothetical protein